ncbi:hypothetical protein [Sorangium sp. So ce388]|uniref:hypothetical protein n=1 Tax=Sorangium sp. So ce388 TaxID=3133309 RepID=UPI003F5BC26F
MLRGHIHVAAWVGVVGLLAACYACDRQRRRVVASGERRALLLRIRLGNALALAKRFRRERNMARAKATEIDLAFQKAVEDWARVNAGEEETWGAN